VTSRQHWRSKRTHHSVRSEHWRYTRYADGSEELYDHRVDPYEWTNLAGQEKYDAVKKRLARWLPGKEKRN